MINTIQCPKCGHEFPISEGLLTHIKEEANQEAEKALRRKIELEKDSEFQDLQKVLQEKEERINDFRKQELELREKSRKLEDKEKDLELETQRRIDEEKKKIEELTARRLIEEHHLKDLEKDQKLQSMEHLVEELKRKSQQGSMQTQGEVAELDLQNTLERLFPLDEIAEVKKGELGGDVRQTVLTQRGTNCGMILWERKRTKAWQEEWVNKLKEDLRRDGAIIGAIVTDVLPKDFKSQIGEKNGVWITTATFVEPLAMLLRKILYDVAKEKAVNLNKQSTAEEVYDFITSNEFAQQVDRIIGTYQEMNEQISKERAVAERQWKQREMQINKLVSGVSGIYGSIQGIAGPALPQVKRLELSDGE